MAQKQSQQSTHPTAVINYNPPQIPHLAVRLPEIIANIMHFLVPHESHLDYEIMFSSKKEKKTYTDIYPCLFVNHLWHDCAARAMWRKIHFDDTDVCYSAMLKLASCLSPANKRAKLRNDIDNSSTIAMVSLAVSKIAPTITMSYDEKDQDEDTDRDDGMVLDDTDDSSSEKILSRSSSFSSYVSTSSTLVHTPPDEDSNSGDHDIDMPDALKTPQRDLYSNNSSFSTAYPHSSSSSSSSSSTYAYNAQYSRRKTYQNALRTFSVRKIKNAQLNVPLSTIGSNAPKIEQLDIYICDNLTNETVIQFVSHAYSRLTYLSLAGCHLICDKSIVKVAQQCPDLVHLDLRACGLVSDVSLTAVARNCPKLKHINVGRVRERERITIKSVGLIAQHTQATVLGLAGCDIDDECMLMLAKHRGPGLERLSVNSCFKITNASVTALLKYCPNLSVFEMKECHRIRDWEAVAEMVQKKVLLTLCDQQNKECLAWAARNGRQLDVKAPVK